MMDNTIALLLLREVDNALQGLEKVVSMLSLTQTELEKEENSKPYAILLEFVQGKMGQEIRKIDEIVNRCANGGITNK